MQKTIANTLVASLLAVPLLVALPTGAATIPYWDVSGSHVIDFEYSGSEYSHDVTLTQDASGNLSGNGGHPAGGPHVYTWVIDSGDVTESEMVFTAHYTASADAVTPLTTLHATGTIAMDGAVSGTWHDNYQGGSRAGTWTMATGTAGALGSLAAEDFGVVDYDTGLGQLAGYSAGFGLDDATFEDVQSVVVKLYASSTLLQTNTATAKVGDEITGDQISSPFDVSGDFDYATDGFWTNMRESEYGQSVAATRVVATVTLANGKVLTAENTNLSGNPSDIFPEEDEDETAPAVPVHLSPANGATVTSAALTKIDWAAVTDPSSPVTYYFESSLSSATDGDGSFTTPAYESGALSDSEIATPGTPEGTYYWHVRAVDSEGNSSAWSSAWSVTVDNSTTTPPTNEGPDSKDACKNGGWKSFSNPSFKNQGQCVSSVAKNK